MRERSGGRPASLSRPSNWYVTLTLYSNHFTFPLLTQQDFYDEKTLSQTCSEFNVDK